MRKTCLLCGKRTSSKGCSFHAGQPRSIYATGPQDGYREVYQWSCCGQYETAEYEPPRSPGCKHLGSHVTRARVLICHYHDASLDEDVSALSSLGCEVQLKLIGDTNNENISGYDCITFIVDSGTIYRLDDLLPSIEDLPNKPWVVVISEDKIGEGSRYHVEATPLKTAILDGLRLHFSRPHVSPFKVFVSYRRVDHPIASTIQRYTGGWLDRMVLGPGVDWGSEIETGIEQCELFVIVVRGRLPETSYVWLELRSALKHGRIIAMLCIKDEGRSIFKKIGVDASKFSTCMLVHKDSTYTHGQVYLEADVEGKILYFSGLGEKLKWSAMDENRWGYDTLKSSQFLANLKHLTTGETTIVPVASNSGRLSSILWLVASTGLMLALYVLLSN